jgi:hypothetical protein
MHKKHKLGILPDLPKDVADAMEKLTDDDVMEIQLALLVESAPLFIQAPDGSPVTSATQFVLPLYRKLCRHILAAAAKKGDV